jgi:hypothetical protein
MADFSRYYSVFRFWIRGLGSFTCVVSKGESLMVGYFQQLSKPNDGN